MRCAFLAIALAATAAHADGLPHIEVGAGTAVPLTVGVEGAVQLTEHLGLELGVGLMPPPYSI